MPASHRSEHQRQLRQTSMSFLGEECTNAKFKACMPMRVAVFVAILWFVVACEMMSERDCSNEGFEPGSPEFSACVRERRTEGSVQMMEEAGQGLNSSGLRGR